MFYMVSDYYSNEDEQEQVPENKVEQSQNSLSAFDDIKQYKELLDLGIITQDEFNAKKKELLGL